MLKQILKDMYVDPDILAELPEEQKQILFFKIREEQKRRYFEMEKQYEKKGFKKPKNKKKKGAMDSTKKFRILEDSNSQPWTWVMGDYPNDLQIEEIWANLGNKDWKPSKRNENQPPVSKVQAIIFAQNKNRQSNPNVAKPTEGKEREKPPINSNNINAPKPEIQNLDGNREPPKPVVNVKKTTTITPTVTATKPLKTPPQEEQAPKQTKVTHPLCDKATLPPRAPKPVAQTPAPVSSFASKSANTVPAGPTSTTKKPSPPVDVKKNLSNKVETDSSDSDPYENMDELADTLPPKEIEEKEWKTQLKRFKAADERRRSHARRASVLVKRQSQQNLIRDQKLLDLRAKFERRRSTREIIHPVIRPELPPKPTNVRPKEGRQGKPATKEEVEEWFKETQSAEVLAYADDNDALPKWFHGIIPRKEAESLLENKDVGDFLVRVSDKIWGYALSYKDENKIKHFLIDGSEPKCFQFFGNDQIRHPGLEQLIAFHQDEPISYGNEILKKEIGQLDPNKPDYGDLIQPMQRNAHINKATNETPL